MKKLTLQDFQNRLSVIHEKEKLKAISWDGDKELSKVQCLDCGTYYIKRGGYFLDKRKISICKKCYPTQSNLLKKDWQPPKEYELVSQYTGMNNKVLVKHLSCGFIWKITPNNLKQGKGCPKCNKKISKGEQRIIKYLTDNNIDFIYQYPLIIEGRNLIIDFFLPQQNLFIEYNGEQHYKPVNFFGGEQKFQQQIFLDNLKQNFLKEKLLVIPYFNLKNIEEILKSSTTISKESTL